MLLDSRDINDGESYLSQYITILKQIWKYGLSVALIFLVTLALFPATTSNVQSMTKELNLWTCEFIHTDSIPP